MRNRRNLARFYAATILISLVSFAQGESLIRLDGETLSGKRIILPDDVRGKAVFMVIGFSKKGGESTNAWRQRLKKDFGTNEKYAVYPVAVLEDVPRLFRSVVISGIRRGTPAGDRDHFIVLLHGEADLKRFVAYSNPDEPYLLLLDAKGNVRWRGHGLFQEADYTALQNAAKALISP